MYQVRRGNQARAFTSHFYQAGTESLTCCLETACSNPQFTLRQLPLNQRLAGEICRCMIYRLISCLCGCLATRALCIHLQNSVVFVCGRLFELDPALLSLFHYSTNCGSTQDCLSSPEFLEHVTKVSSFLCSDHHYKYTVCTLGIVLSAYLHLLPGDACDRCSSQPLGRPSLLGGLSA